MNQPGESQTELKHIMDVVPKAIDIGAIRAVNKSNDNDTKLFEAEKRAALVAQRSDAKQVAHCWG